MNNQPHFVVVGGGAGGLELAIGLARFRRKGARLKVTLIDREPAHIWKPRLHEIASGFLVAADEELDFAEQAAIHGFTFVLGEVVGLDPAAKSVSVNEVVTNDSRLALQVRTLLPTRQLAYDNLVLAMGSKSNDFGIPGVAECCFTLDSTAAAEKLRGALLESVIRASDRAFHPVRVVIVGAGTTGVELAAELRSAACHQPELTSLILPEQMDVTLIEMADRPLPGGDEATSEYARRILEESGVHMRLGTKVLHVAPGAVHLPAEKVNADIIVWASGIKGHALSQSIPDLSIDPSGRIKVDAALRALNSAGLPVEGLFCIGDCAAYYAADHARPTPANAQAAHQQARLLAASFGDLLAGGSLRQFEYRNHGTLVSLGAERAVGEYPVRAHRPVEISGLAAKVGYNGLYWSHLAACLGWPRTAALALSDVLRRRGSPKAKLRW